MISEDKVKLMTKIAMYESGEGKKDLEIAHFHIHQYINIETIKSLLISTIAYALMVCLLTLVFMDSILKLVERHGYGRYIFLVLLLYVVFVSVQCIYARHRSKDQYEEALPRIRQYKKDLNKLFFMYELREHPEEIKQEELEETLEEEMNAESVEF